MKNSATDKLLFVFSFCLAGTLLWICGDRGNQIEHLKANPIHDTIYVVNEANDYIKVKTSETDTVLIPVYKIKKK